MPFCEGRRAGRDLYWATYSAGNTVLFFWRWCATASFLQRDMPFSLPAPLSRFLVSRLVTLLRLPAFFPAGDGISVVWQNGGHVERNLAALGYILYSSLFQYAMPSCPLCRRTTNFSSPVGCPPEHGSVYAPSNHAGCPGAALRGYAPAGMHCALPGRLVVLMKARTEAYAGGAWRTRRMRYTTSTAAYFILFLPRRRVLFSGLNVT